MVTNAFILLIHVMANVCQDFLNVENIVGQTQLTTLKTTDYVKTNVFILIILPSTDQQQQEALIEKYMQLPNAVWDDIINQVAFSKLLLFYFDKENFVLIIF